MENQPTQSQQPQPPQPSKSKRRDRAVKIGFLVVVIAVATWVYLGVQRPEPELPGWLTDLAKAEVKAKQEGRQIVVMFTSRPMTPKEREYLESDIKHWKIANALKREGYVLVHLNTRTDAELAKANDITLTPSFLLLDPNGTLIRKQIGIVNNIEFCKGFLGVPVGEPNG